MPTSRVVADGELVLVDAGAEVRGYASDITLTYPASGSFTPEQEALHTVVAASCAAAIEHCVPGNEWLDVHATAAGEVLRGRTGTRPGFPPVRVDLPLEPGYCFTVEPGIYFVPALLQDDERRQTHADAVEWDRVDLMLDFGGIRIEHNVLVTDDGFDVLTADVLLLG